MKLTLSLILVASISFGQSKPKWIKVGDSEWKDTVTTYYALKGKDSLSFEVQKTTCQCDLYIDIENKTHSAKGLILHFIMTNMWDWRKSITTVHGKIIATAAPKWESDWGLSNNSNGVYEIKGKYIYVKQIHRVYSARQIKEYHLKNEWLTVELQ